MDTQSSRDELVHLVQLVIRPKDTGLSSEEINKKLLRFCSRCPDPVGAMRLIVEGTAPTTAEQIVEDALALPRRSIEEVSLAELPSTHPLRTNEYF